MHDLTQKTASAQRCALGAEFGERCHQLAQCLRPEERNRLLAFWALPRDRRLPYALLNMSMQQLLESSFHDLLATPGIGPKKMEALLMLLQRALADHHATVSRVSVSSTSLASGLTASVELQSALHPLQQKAAEAGDNFAWQSPPEQPFDPLAVSELQWEACRQTMLRHQLQHETLGKLAPCLRNLPTVIWNRPIETYLSLNLMQMRTLKTHGEKRIGSVLEVFLAIHQLLADTAPHPHYVIRLQPTFIAPVEQWLRVVLLQPQWVPTLLDLRQQLALPLLNQIAHDAGESVHRLACGRLGIETEPEQVRDQAISLGVTRARIYQLLTMCTQVMEVRWPEGRWLIAELTRRCRSTEVDDRCTSFCETLSQLLFARRPMSAHTDRRAVQASSKKPIMTE